MRVCMCLAGAAALLGCGSATGTALGRPVVDTLPGGAVRVTNTTPTLWADSASGWRVVEELRITGEPGTDSEIIEPQAVALDAEGRVWVSDQKPTRLKVYGRDGRLVRIVGAEGEGPGEFRVAFPASAGEYVVVQDPRTSRASVFDTAGRFIRSFRSQCCYWTPIRVDRAGLVYIPGPLRGEDRGRGPPWIRYRLDGTVADTLYSPRSRDTPFWEVRGGSGRNEMMMTVAVPYAPSELLALDPTGGLVTGYSGAYELAVLRNGRDTVQRFGRAWTPEPLDEAGRRDTVEGMIRRFAQGPLTEAALRGAFRLADVPSTRPAFESIQVDPAGRRWVGLGGPRYDVFDSTGAWLGPIRMPVTFAPWRAWFGDDRIAASIELDDGRPAVVVLRIERPEGRRRR